MTLFEISEKYNIPPEIIKEYEHRFLCGKYENTAGPHEYSDEDIENLSIIITLRDIGFSAEETDRYMRASSAVKKITLCSVCFAKKEIHCCARYIPWRISFSVLII